MFSRPTFDYTESYRLWPSVVLAAFVAVVVPTQWVDYADRYGPKLLNFHPLFLVLYVPLAFGLVWPVMVGIHALFARSLPLRHPTRCKVAMFVFVFSAICSTPFLFEEYTGHKSEQLRLAEEAHARNLEVGQQHQAISQNTQQISEKGSLSFIEPLASSESAALEEFFSAAQLAPGDCLRAAQRYHTSIPVLIRLAANKSCSPDGLQFLYDDALQLQAAQTSNTYPPPVDVLDAVAGNLNCPSELLTKLMRSEDFSIRVHAARNPNAPEPQKIAFLRSCASSADLGERQFAVADPDTPPDVLEQLAAEPDLVYRVATNPHTPESVLKHIAETASDAPTRKRASETLAHRR